MAVTNYETTVHLPSNGNLYSEEERIPADVTIRAITTAEEKFLLGSSSVNALDKIIEACIVKPKGLRMANLVLADENFLLYKLRIHTYGPEYNITTTCPHCGASNDSRVDLNDFIVYELGDDFEEPFDIELPMSGDTLTCRLLRKGAIDAIETRARKLASKMPGVGPDEVAYNMRLARYITQINGKDVTWDEAQQYTEHMHGRDSAWFWHEINSIRMGYDTDVEIDCPSCGNTYDTPLPMTQEFFRPSFE